MPIKLVSMGIFILKQQYDLNRILDPIRSADPDHAFSAKLTWLRAPVEHINRNGKRTGLYKAKFNVRVENLSDDKTLTHLKINGRKIWLKDRNDATDMGLMSGEVFNKSRFVFLGHGYDGDSEDISLTNIKSGWWADRPAHLPNDYEKKTVPEPFTILGTALALGFGAFFKRGRSLKSN